MAALRVSYHRILDKIEHMLPAKLRPLYNHPAGNLNCIALYSWSGECVTLAGIYQNNCLFSGLEHYSIVIPWFRSQRLTFKTCPSYFYSINLYSVNPSEGIIHFPPKMSNNGYVLWTLPELNIWNVKSTAVTWKDWSLFCLDKGTGGQVNEKNNLTRYDGTPCRSQVLLDLNQSKNSLHIY